MKQSFPLLRYAFLMALSIALAWSAKAEDGTLLYTIEAEDYDTTSFAGVDIKSSEWASDSLYVEDISPSQFLQYNNVVVPTEGSYKLRLHYYNRDKAGRNISAWTNQQARQSILAPDTTGAWDGGLYVKVTQIINGTDTTYTRDTIPGTEGSKSIDMILYFRAGANKLRIGGTPGSTLANGYCPNFDYFELFTTDSVIAKPADVPNSWRWDYTDESTVTSDGNYSNLKNIYDNNDNTFFEINPNGSANITFAFDTLMNINGCLFYLGEDIEFNPDNWEVQYSLNGIDWSSSSRTAKDAKGLSKVYMLSTPGVGFKYIRLVITSTETIKIAEFQLFGFPRIFEKAGTAPFNVQYPDDLTGRQAIDSSIGSFSANDPGLTSFKEVAANAIDGIQNKYTVNGKLIGMQYEFNEEVFVGSYSLGIGMSGDKGRNPKNIKLYGAGWDMDFKLISEVLNFAFPHVDYNSMKFPIDYPGMYVYYKIDIENNGANMSHLSEWQLFEAQIDTTIVNGVANQPVMSNKLCRAFGRQGEIQINKTTQAAATYQVVDLIGKVMKQGVLNETQAIAVKQGIYMVRVFANEQVQTLKVLVK